MTLTESVSNNYIVVYPVSCEGLPESWKEMTTETQFPLTPGSEVSLKCSTGYTLTGDTTVTCTEGTVFSFIEAPSCVQGLSKIQYNAFSVVKTVFKMKTIKSILFYVLYIEKIL